MQSTRPLLNLVKHIISSSSLKANGHKISLLRSRFGYSNTHITMNNRPSFYRLFSSPAGKSGFPNKLDLQPGDHAVGLEALEQHAMRQGKLLPYQAVLTGAFGTVENPVLVPTVFKERYVGCCGGSGEHGEPEEHDTVFFLITEGIPVLCPDCAQAFKLVPNKYPEEFINLLTDEHESHDHHDVSPDNVHHIEINPINSKDVDNVLSNGYSLKKLPISESIIEMFGHNGHGHGHGHADAHAGHKATTHKVDTHKVDTHKVDTHKVDTHKVDTHKVDTTSTRKVDTHAGHKH